MRKPINLLLALALFPPLLAAQDQVSIKTGIKGGADFVDLFSSRSNSFKNEAENTFGLFTGLSSATNPDATVILGMELNYVKSIYYKSNQQTPYDDRSDLVVYNGDFDEQFVYEFVEFCFPVEVYPTLFNKDFTFGIYVEPAIGLGNSFTNVKETSRTFIDSLKGFNYDLDYQEPTGYPGGSGFCVPMSLNIGVSGFYRFIVIDLRYKYTFNISPTTNNLFLQLGFAF